MSTRVGTAGTGVGVLGATIVANPEGAVVSTVVDTAVAGSTQIAGAATTALAVTGSSTEMMGVTGLVVIAAGGLMVRFARSRSQS